MIKYNPDNLTFARQNRRQRNATPQEGILWHCCLKKFEVHFYRQYRVGNYILDFYCPKRRLAIEVDGGQHYDEIEMQKDKRRTAFLNENGIEVLRFTNLDIDNNLKGVQKAICIALERRKR